VDANRPLLLDLTCLCDAHTDQALEGIFKAIGEDPPDNGIWDEHPNPMVRRIVELFTERGLGRIGGLEAEFNAWLAGAEYREGLERPARPPGAMARWSGAELGTARLYLQRLPPELWELEDWLLLVDYLVQRHLSPADLRSEADWLTTRSALMGRVQAAMALTAAETDSMMQSPDFGDLGAAPLSEALRAAIGFGRERACENVVQLSDNARHAMRKLVVDFQEAFILGDKVGAAESLQGRLLDEFGKLNRDWRRIAVTEATENINQGMVASCEPGTRLKRIERYRGACPFCRSIDGRVFTVVAASTPDKDGQTEVWLGKTNIGRSASPQRRVGGQLVDREAHELWWPAAGAQHPHCRGSWVRVTGATPDPQFQAWLDGLEKRGRK
jgi:hypothetical protein